MNIEFQVRKMKYKKDDKEIEFLQPYIVVIYPHTDYKVSIPVGAKFKNDIGRLADISKAYMEYLAVNDNGF